MFPAPPPARGPLLSRTNSLSSRVLVKQVRRKTSFVRIIDSSEEIPSPHASIYDAHQAFEDVLRDGMFANDMWHNHTDIGRCNKYERECEQQLKR